MNFLLLASLFGSAAAGADVPIKDDCVLGQSQLIHGLSPADAEARIKQYARLYVENYSSYKRGERDTRRQMNGYLGLDVWTQDDIVGFTRQQRELLFISIAGELAVGKIDTSELPGYVVAIERKIHEIEVELGCN